MRIVFMATGEIAEATFSSALRDFEVLGLVTQPDRPVGRKQELRPPGVKILAEKMGVPVFQPESVKNDEALEVIRAWNPEVIVVMAYGQILPQALIDLPQKAIINLHASLLPKYRGASCIQAAILNGDGLTGWTVMHVVKALDAGDIILQKELRIGEKETGGELHDRLAELAPEALSEALAAMATYDDGRLAQDEAASSYAPKLVRDDGLLDWSKPAVELERLIRAYDPWPGTMTGFLEPSGKKKRLKIFPQTEVASGVGEPGEVIHCALEGIEVATGQGSLIIHDLQLEGARRMDAQEFLRGRMESVRGQTFI